MPDLDKEPRQVSFVAVGGSFVKVRGKPHNSPASSGVEHASGRNASDIGKTRAVVSTIF